MPTTSQRGARLTYDDFVRIPDDGKRHEIIDGVHYVTPSPDLRHQELGGAATSVHRRISRGPDLIVGRVILAPFDVVFSFHDVVEPDLVFVAPDQLDILTDQNIQGTPALVIEVLSPSTRSRDDESSAALRALRRARVLAGRSRPPRRDCVPAHTGATFPTVTLTAAARNTLETPLLPGWSLAMSRLFR